MRSPAGLCFGGKPAKCVIDWVLSGTDRVDYQAGCVRWDSNSSRRLFSKP